MQQILIWTSDGTILTSWTFCDKEWAPLHMHNLSCMIHSYSRDNKLLLLFQ